MHRNFRDCGGEEGEASNNVTMISVTCVDVVCVLLQPPRRVTLSWISEKRRAKAKKVSHFLEWQQEALTRRKSRIAQFFKRILIFGFFPLKIFHTLLVPTVVYVTSYSKAGNPFLHICRKTKRVWRRQEGATHKQTPSAFQVPYATGGLARGKKDFEKGNGGGAR